MRENLTQEINAGLDYFLSKFERAEYLVDNGTEHVKLGSPPLADMCGIREAGKRWAFTVRSSRAACKVYDLLVLT